MSSRSPSLPRPLAKRHGDSSCDHAALWRGVVGGLALFVAACSGGEVRAPNPTRPLPERRAVEIIRRAITGDGARPAPPRDEKLQPSGKTIKIDVAIAGHEYGVAYVTSDDARELGEALPPPNKKDERLRIVRGGADGEVRIVVLYQDNYLYDDLAGDAHEQTTVAVENQLTRDVQDFLVHAKAQGYR